MKISGYSERGIINSLLYEINYRPHAEILKDLVFERSTMILLA
ncbi:MAG: hypothetical protein ACFFCW_28135 [Candidatus Hodarchaeota archaeon]